MLNPVNVNSNTVESVRASIIETTPTTSNDVSEVIINENQPEVQRRKRRSREKSEIPLEI